jgi:hypothetical protein
MLHPILRLAPIGFSSAARHALADALASIPGTGPRWALARHEQSDAWLVHPDVVDLQTDHARVWDSADRLAAATVHFDRIPRPVAVAVGAAADGASVDLPPAAQHIPLLESLESSALGRVLAQFEQRLRLLRAQFAFGEILLMKRPHVTNEKRGYQLSYHQQLIALVDTLNMMVHVGRKAVPVSIAQATWQPRPVGAANPADSEFKSFTVQECLWEFSQRTEELWLPTRYKTKPVYFWRTPSLRSGFYQDEHLGLLALLRQKPHDFAALKMQTGWNDRLLSKTIEGLWVTGAISTLPMKEPTAPGLMERLFSRKQADADSNLPGDSSSPSSARSMDWARDTAPAELEPGENSRLDL